MKLVRKVFVPEHDCVFVPFTPLKQYVGQKYVGIQSTKSPMCQYRSSKTRAKRQDFIGYLNFHTL